MADALSSDGSIFQDVWVQIPSAAPNLSEIASEKLVLYYKMN